MTTITFDRLAYLETLKPSGIPEAQARAHTTALDDALRDTVATKGDIQALRSDIEIVKRDLMIWIGTMIIALGGVLIAIKYFG